MARRRTRTRLPTAHRAPARVQDRRRTDRGVAIDHDALARRVTLRHAPTWRRSLPEPPMPAACARIAWRGDTTPSAATERWAGNSKVRRYSVSPSSSARLQCGSTALTAAAVCAVSSSPRRVQGTSQRQVASAARARASKPTVPMNVLRSERRPGQRPCEFEEMPPTWDERMSCGDGWRWGKPCGDRLEIGLVSGRTALAASSSFRAVPAAARPADGAARPTRGDVHARRS